jgi:hypothetical protein
MIPTRNTNPNTSESEQQVTHENPTKITWKRHEKHSSHKKEIDVTMKASIHLEVRFSTKQWRKSKPMEQGNEKQSKWMICPETLELYIWSPSGLGKWPSYLYNLKWDTHPSGAIWSSSTPLLRTVVPLSQSMSSRRKPCDPATCPPTSKLLGTPVSPTARRASGLDFVAQPSNPTVLWWTSPNSACRLRSWAATLHRLQSTTLSYFSCHHATRTWPRWPPGPSSRSYLLSTPRRPRKATLSITHHTKERPSTGPRPLRSSMGDKT